MSVIARTLYQVEWHIASKFGEKFPGIWTEPIGWVSPSACSLGRDQALEQQILADIRQRLATTPQPSAPLFAPPQ